MNSPVRELARYVPQIKNKRWFTKVCDGSDYLGRANGGLHDQEQFKKAVSMLERAAHNWRRPRLFHIIQTGSNVSAYQKLLNEFSDRLRRAGVLCEWVRCIEFDSTKGLHCHVMMVISTPDTLPSRYLTTANEHGKEKVSLLRQVVREVQADSQDLKVRVQAPASHPGGFIEFNQTNQQLLNEAVEWCSYIFKLRSKPTSGQCYQSSRPARRRCGKVCQDATPPVCLATCAVTQERSFQSRYPTTASGRKCLKTPVYAGFSHLRGISDLFSPLEPYEKEYKKSDKSHFSRTFSPTLHRPPPARICSASDSAGQPDRATKERFQPPRHGRQEGVYNNVTVVRQFYTPPGPA